MWQLYVLMQWLLSPDPWQLDCFTSSTGMGNVCEGDFVQRRIAAMDYKPWDSVGLTIKITLHRHHYVYRYCLSLDSWHHEVLDVDFNPQSTHPTACPPVPAPAECPQSLRSPISRLWVLHLLLSLTLHPPDLSISDLQFWHRCTLISHSKKVSILFHVKSTFILNTMFNHMVPSILLLHIFIGS